MKPTSRPSWNTLCACAGVTVGSVALSAGQLSAQMPWPVAKVKPAATSTAPVPPAPAKSVDAKPTAPVVDLSAPKAAASSLGHAAGKPVPQDAVGAQQSAANAGQWLPQEIADAQNACVVLLKGLDVVAVAAAPMRDNECGAPAPIEVISVGKSPQVTFSPPVVVTCDMAAALHTWVTGDLQGLAKKHLGAPLIRIETMSSYSCRTAYGRRQARLSEHGKANAIDIRAFLTAKAEQADVLANWGPTDRDIAAQIAAAKAAAQKQPVHVAQPVSPTTVPGVPTVAGSATPAAAVAETTRPAVTIGIPGVPGSAFPSTPSAIGLSNGLPQPNRLGGPKPSEPPLRGTTAIEMIDSRMKFLKGAHASACRIFATVLGPESNNAHRNHFHVDMAKRKSASFCE